MYNIKVLTSWTSVSGNSGFLLLLFAAFIVSCGERSAKHEQSKPGRCVSTLEVINGDTVNLVDCHDKKQGKWIRFSYIPVRDTLWNKGDTIFYKDDIILWQR